MLRMGLQPDLRADVLEVRTAHGGALERTAKAASEQRLAGARSWQLEAHCLLPVELAADPDFYLHMMAAQEIYDKLDAAPVVSSPWNASQSLYNLHAACEDLYRGVTKGCAPRSDHPGHLMGLGSIPGLQHGIDLEVMNATFAATAKIWDLQHGYYGTDPHLVAITAARLERREEALHFALLDSDENRFSVMGHQLNFARVSGYLPGNGALLQVRSPLSTSCGSAGPKAMRIVHLLWDSGRRWRRWRLASREAALPRRAFRWRGRSSMRGSCPCRDTTMPARESARARQREGERRGASLRPSRLRYQMWSNRSDLFPPMITQACVKDAFSAIIDHAPRLVDPKCNFLMGFHTPQEYHR